MEAVALSNATAHCLDSTRRDLAATMVRYRRAETRATSAEKSLGELRAECTDYQAHLSRLAERLVETANGKATTQSDDLLALCNRLVETIAQRDDEIKLLRDELREIPPPVRRRRSVTCSPRPSSQGGP